MKILVSGGTGMLGRNLQYMMPQAEYVGSSFDLKDYKECLYLVERFHPNVVVHLASKVGGIKDNMSHPVKYLEDNLLMNTNILRACAFSAIPRFIGILSTCIYPILPDDQYPMSEDVMLEGTPEKTNFGYAYAKRCMAIQIEAYKKQYGWNYSYLIPCNLYGKYDSSMGTRAHFVTALIQKIIQAKNLKQNYIELFGDGTPLRQFMCAKDLAKVINYVIHEKISESFNVATDEVKSIDQIARIALRACDADLEIRYIKGPNGQRRKDVSIEKMKKLIPEFKQTSLYDGILETYWWMKNS